MSIKSIIMMILILGLTISLFVISILRLMAISGRNQ